jgi:choline kinase
LNDQKCAVILAAGRGSRLKELSLENPKPMTIVKNDTIIENLVKGLIEANIERIILVVGYKADKLINHVEKKFKAAVEFVFINNDIYDKTNNIYSLWLAREYLNDGFYLFEADVYCDTSIIKQLVTNDDINVMMIDKYISQMEGTVVSLNESNQVVNMFLKRDQDESFTFDNKYKTINFYRINSAFAKEFFIPKLDEHIQGKDVGSYYEQIIKEAVDEEYVFKGIIPENGRWWEIDTKEDLIYTREVFEEN